MYGTTNDPEFQSNTEEQKSSRRHNSPRPQTILQSHSHQDSVVLVPKQANRAMEENREPINKIFDQGGKNIKWEKDIVFREYCWETWTAVCNSMKLEHTLTPGMKKSLKYVFVICGLIKDGHFDWCEVVSCGSFDWHFSTDQGH